VVTDFDVRRFENEATGQEDRSNVLLRVDGALR